jgi:hypothetical protein
VTELGGSALGEDPGGRSSFPRELGKPVAQALHWRRPSPGASSPDGRHLDHLRHLRVPPPALPQHGAESDSDDVVEASEEDESRRRRSDAASLQNSIQRAAASRVEQRAGEQRGL